MKIARDTARAVVVHDGHILLMERWRRDENGRSMHYFSVPGGGIEKGESPEVAVVRELYEEMTVLVRPQYVLGKTKRIGGGTHAYYVCQYLSGRPLLNPASPEARRTSPKNQHLPCWVSESQFARLPLHPEYEPMRAKIAALFAAPRANRATLE